MRDESPSTTAQLIAASQILAAHDASLRHLVAPGAAEWSERFLRGTRGGRMLARSVQSWLGVRVARLIERAALPGVIRHWIQRKRWIERRVRAALDEGFSQFVVLGAGFDALGVRLASEGAVARVVEIDHPATQRVKRAALADSSVVSVPIDLARGLPRWDGDELGRAIVATHDTIVVAEGLLMYLDEERVRELLRWIATLPPRRVRLIFSFMVARPNEPIGFESRRRALNWWLRRKGEPFRWALAPDDVERFVGALGWRLRARGDAEALAREDSSAVRAIRGEELIEVERA